MQLFLSLWMLLLPLRLHISECYCFSSSVSSCVLCASLWQPQLSFLSLFVTFAPVSDSHSWLSCVMNALSRLSKLVGLGQSPTASSRRTAWEEETFFQKYERILGELKKGDHSYNGQRKNKFKFGYSATSKCGMIEVWKMSEAAFLQKLHSVPRISNISYNTSKTSQKNIGGHCLKDFWRQAKGNNREQLSKIKKLRGLPSYC